MTTERQPLNWEIRLINPAEHWDALYNLYRKILLGDAPMEQFLWKYKANPLGPMKVWSVWNLKSNQMIAAFSAYERQFIHQGKIVTVYQQADAMVQAEYRRHGIFKKLINAMSEHLRQKGVLFHFGYPNNKSGPIVRKYDIAREIYHSRVMVYINGFRNAAETLFKSDGIVVKILPPVLSPFIRSLNTLRGHKCKGSVTLAPLKDFNHLPEQWSLENAVLHQYFPYRSREFLRWRALEVPGFLQKDLFNFWCLRDGQKIGYFVLYRDSRRNVLKIIDHLCTRPKENMVECFRAVRRLAIKEKYDAVTTNVASSLYQKALLRAGFIRNKSVRCTIFFLQPKYLPEKDLPGNFWLQLPVDRDVIDY